MDNYQPLTDTVDPVVDGRWIVTLRRAASVGTTLKDPLNQEVNKPSKAQTLTCDNC